MLEFDLSSCILLIIKLFTLYIGLAVTANEFLCPSLLVISKTLRLSQNIAGVTFLAFGNGSPDIFSSIAGIKHARAELVIGQLFGGGIFVTSVVVGLILLNKDFKVMERPLIRDILFYLTATYLTWFMFWNQIVDIRISITFISIYIIYIMVVIIGRLIYNCCRDDKPKKISFDNGLYEEKKKLIQDNNNLIKIEKNYPPNDIYSININQETNTYAKMNELDQNSILTIYEDVNSNNDYKYQHLVSEKVKNRFSRFFYSKFLYNNDNQWVELLHHICPLKIDKWNSHCIAKKLFCIIKIPIYFLLTITIPVINYDKYKNNWCRLLNALHCITGPLFILIISGNLLRKVGDEIPLVAIVLLISCIFACLVCFTSKFEHPPKYHFIFGYCGFIISVFWIYRLASEVVNLLNVFKIMFNLSDTILGLTILAWGNSLGDFISNVSMARQGFPRMGLSACFGASLLNLLLGIGLPYTIALGKEHFVIKLEYTHMITLLYSTITFSLLSTILILYFSGFYSKKFHGIFLLGLYLVYVVLAVLIELKIL